jgi:hypothetical protein
MCLRLSYKKKIRKKYFFAFASFKSLKKEVGSGVGSGSVSQRYGSAPKCHRSPTLPRCGVVLKYHTPMDLLLTTGKNHQATLRNDPDPRIHLEI